MESYYIWIIIFSIIGYVIVTDKSVATAFVYISDILKNKIVKEIWWIKNNPRNPIVKYLMWRKSVKMAQDLMKEFDIKRYDE